jgi:hypothetical protein
MNAPNYAWFDAAAYGREDVANELRAQGWRRLPAIPKAVLFARGKQVVAAFRGTNLLDTEDLADDAALLTGNEDSRIRFQNARRWILGLCKRYSKSEVWLTGHSLGGSICMSIIYKTPNVRYVHTYNAFASPHMISQSGGTSPIANYKIVTMHLIIQDPISTTSLLMSDVAFDVKPVIFGLDPHGIENWL